MDFFSLSEVYSASGIDGFMSFAKFGDISAIISLSTFLTLLFLLFFQTSKETNVKSFVRVPQVPAGYFICFFPGCFFSVAQIR